MDHLTLLLSRDLLVIITRQGVRHELRLADCLSRTDVAVWLFELIQSIPNGPRSFQIGTTATETLNWFWSLARSPFASAENVGAVVQGLEDVVRAKHVGADQCGLLMLVAPESIPATASVKAK